MTFCEKKTQPNERTGDFKKVAASDMQLAATCNNAAKNASRIGFAVSIKNNAEPKCYGSGVLLPTDKNNLCCSKKVDSDSEPS